MVVFNCGTLGCNGSVNLRHISDTFLAIPPSFFISYVWRSKKIWINRWWLLWKHLATFHNEPRADLAKPLSLGTFWREQEQFAPIPEQNYCSFLVWLTKTEFGLKEKYCSPVVCFCNACKYSAGWDSAQAHQLISKHPRVLPQPGHHRPENLLFVVHRLLGREAIHIMIWHRLESFCRPRKEIISKVHQLLLGKAPVSNNRLDLSLPACRSTCVLYLCPQYPFQGLICNIWKNRKRIRYLPF